MFKEGKLVTKNVFLANSKKSFIFFLINEGGRGLEPENPSYKYATEYHISTKFSS